MILFSLHRISKEIVCIAPAYHLNHLISWHCLFPTADQARASVISSKLDESWERAEHTVEQAANCVFLVFVCEKMLYPVAEGYFGCYCVGNDYAHGWNFLSFNTAVPNRYGSVYRSVGHLVRTESKKNLHYFRFICFRIWKRFYFEKLPDSVLQPSTVCMKNPVWRILPGFHEGVAR